MWPDNICRVYWYLWKKEVCNFLNDSTYNILSVRCNPFYFYDKMLLKNILKKIKKGVDNVKDIWYIINALEKRRCKRESSLKTEQNVNLSS